MARCSTPIDTVSQTNCGQTRFDSWRLRLAEMMFFLKIEAQKRITGGLARRTYLLVVSRFFWSSCCLKARTSCLSSCLTAPCSSVCLSSCSSCSSSDSIDCESKSCGALPCSQLRPKCASKDVWRSGKVESEKEWMEEVEAALNSRLISNWWIEVEFFSTYK